jgi:hypothetical protein
MVDSAGHAMLPLAIQHCQLSAKVEQILEIEIAISMVLALVIATCHPHQPLAYYYYAEVFVAGTCLLRTEEEWHQEWQQ